MQALRLGKRLHRALSNATCSFTARRALRSQHTLTNYLEPCLYQDTLLTQSPWSAIQVRGAKVLGSDVSTCSIDCAFYEFIA